MNKIKKYIGIIKWFDQLKGFGVIVNHENKEFFIHKSNILDSPDKILKATSFVFEEGSKKKGKSSPAVNCTIPKTQNDFNLAMELIGKPRTVGIEVKIIGKSSWGNSYTKRELGKYDILNYFLYKVLKDKSKSDIIDFFRDAFNENITGWGISEITDFYRVTKNRINALKLEPEGTENKTERFTGMNEGNYKVIKHLIDYYNANISSKISVQLWKSGDLDYSENSKLNIDQGFYLKKDLPFDQNYLVEHISLLNAADFKNISKYNIRDEVNLKLINSFFSDIISNIETLKEKVEVYNILDSSQREELFKMILTNITSGLLFDVWSNKRLFVDYETKKLRLYFPDSADYFIDEKILFENCSSIGFDLIKRIKTLNGESTKQIFSILKLKVERKLIDTENLIENIKAIKLLKGSEQNIILQLIFPQLVDEQISLLIENNFLQFSEKQCALLNFSLDIDDNTKTRFINVIAGDYKIEIRKRLRLLKILSEDALKSFSVKYIKEFNDAEKLIFTSFCDDLNVFIAICNNWLFENVYLTRKLLVYGGKNNFSLSERFQAKLLGQFKIFSNKAKLEILRYYLHDPFICLCIESFDFSFPDEVEMLFTLIDPGVNYKEEIIEVFDNQKNNISILDLFALSKLFKKYNLYFDNSDLEIRFQQTLKSEELIGLVDFLAKLKGEDFKLTETQIVNYINCKLPENDALCLNIIPLVISSNLLISILNKCTSLVDSSKHLNSLSNNKIFKNLSEEFIKEHLMNYLEKEPIKILDLALIHFKNLYVYFADRILLNNKVFIGFHSLLLKKSKEINAVFDEKDNDLNILTRSFNDPLNECNIAKLQDLFVRHKYAFQSDFIKFNAYLVYKNHQSVLKFKKILSSYEFTELSALLINSFILYPVKSRSELMSLMNRILKEHFNLLTKNIVTIDTYINIYSIRNLVKKCNGRKKYSGINFWQSGQASRFYTKGYHFLISGESEDIYCEGRFWKSQHFYNSETNKPTEELYDFYWCKNAVCAGVNDKIEFGNEYENWTLIELNELFNINLDRLAFIYLAGWLNRMQTIFDRLICMECCQYLRPKNYKPHLLGYYAVPLFCCVNDKCQSFNKPIRFTHCRGCGKILDSRECKVCSTCKWLICDDKTCNKCGCGANHTPVFVEYE
ncbi:cold shock domain-containing protein [Tamlana sp. s12]|uniref:cold shock domain-containing protein n=1 Tax=Tamlana sp. s12 TaxID=1630406 RepID=UPI0007FF3A56|nr:cold shock domain-containing protein [Tamlana sp. s12]OBQ52799.1 hypothetical protein VQ01_12660 [Tamlana sp. s12]QQY81180.1 cold shock domain-containing protein [Tamlana sp. s12]